uniref:Uncharacterized protein n=1 Tax=Molossus molossus TaxID=27622 RepID=A0A7J8DC04_MOLMO|nr:hypothetical protein HJG59_009394 [Molossus molossus]
MNCSELQLTQAYVTLRERWPAAPARREGSSSATLPAATAGSGAGWALHPPWEQSPARSQQRGAKPAARSTHRFMAAQKTPNHPRRRGTRRATLPHGPQGTQAHPMQVGQLQNRWLGHRHQGRHPCGQGDRGYPKDSFPSLKRRRTPSSEEHFNRTYVWLKLSLPWRPGVRLTP